MAISAGWLLTEVLITSFAIFAAVYFYFRNFLYSYWREKGVFYVEPTVPIGNLWSVLRRKITIGEHYANAYAAHKGHRYFGMYALYKPNLVVAEPEIIKQILTKQFSHFHDRGMYCNEKVDPFSGHLFFLSGSKWRNLRAKLTPTFTSGKMKHMFGIMVECGKQITRYLAPKAEGREVVDVKDLFARFSTDVIMSSAFGITCNSIDTPNNEFRYWGRKIFQSKPLIYALVFMAPEIMDLFSIPFTDKGVSKFFTNVFIETVTYRETNNVTRNDFLNLIMQLMKRGYVDGDDKKAAPSIADTTGGNITLMEGAAQAYVFFAAGFETTSSTITYCLYELARNQEIQDKVMKDIDVALEKHGGLTFESVNEMPYLQKVISETLRKYPPLPLLNRVCTKDIDLPTTNFHVSKGMGVVIPVFGVHRDPDIYPEPDKFDPERFNPENIAARHPYSYLPFGEGPRICIGMRFGFAQTKVGVISVLSKYRVKFAPNTPNTLKWNPGNAPLTVKGDINLIVEPR